MTTHLTINLYKIVDRLQLESVRFRRENVLVSTRGGYEFGTDCNSFRWTKAVKALTLLAAGSALASSQTFYLKGGHGSLASSLDYATSKSPGWLLGMFGQFKNKIPVSKILIQRINPERRNGGNVQIFLNHNLLQMENIHIYYHQSKLDRNSLSILFSRLSEELNLENNSVISTLESPRD